MLRLRKRRKNAYEEMISTDVVSKYSNMVTYYYSSVYDIRDAWALCYRNNLLLRCNNTNNPLGDQFLVPKDDVLNITKKST